MDTVKAAPHNAIDVSQAQDGSVLAWYERNGELYGEKLYDVYIGGDGGVMAPENSSYLFADLARISEVDFGNAFDTSNVTNMDYMFSKCWELTELDVSGFDTSNVTTMDYMFHMCVDLRTLDVSGFDTSNVTDIGYPFAGCNSLPRATINALGQNA